MRLRDRPEGVMPPLSAQHIEKPVRKTIEEKLIARDFAGARDLVRKVVEEASEALRKPGVNLEELRTLEDTLNDSLGRLVRGLLLEFAVPDNPEIGKALTAAKEILRQVSERRTEALLERAGPNIKRALELLIQEHPELASITLRNDEEAASMYHRHADFSNPQSIAIKTNDAFYQEAMTKRSISVGVFAELLGVPQSEMNPEILKVLILAHEFGHAHDVLNNFGSDRFAASRTFTAQRKEELSSLPVPGMNPGNLEHLIATGHWEELAQTYTKLKDRHPEDVVAQQELAYRHLKTERYADVFAANFTKKHWGQFNFST